MKSLVAAACTLSLVACVQQDEAPQDIDRALPTADQVSIKLPDSNARTIGQLANWYVATRDVTRTFNGGTAWVLILVHTIVKFPVTTVNGDTYTWGPWSDALDPAEYKLDVRAVFSGSLIETWSLVGNARLMSSGPLSSLMQATRLRAQVAVRRVLNIARRSLLADR